MVSRTVTVATLVEARVPLSWREAVALVQSIAEFSQHRSSAREGNDPLAHMALDPSGEVIAPASGGLAASQSELALLLVQMLRPDGADELESTPPGVYAVISRALGLSDEPAFRSVAELSVALQRFECGSRQSALRGVYARCMQHLDYRLHAATTHERGARDPAREQGAERRRTGGQVAALRRMLRELDRDAYLMRAAEATRTREPREPGLLSSLIPVSALAFAVLVTASAGNQQWQDEVRQPVRAEQRTAPSSARSGDARASVMIENPSKQATDYRAAADSFDPHQAETPGVSRLDGLAARRGPRVQSRARRPDTHARVPVAPAQRQVATTESTLVPPRATRRWPQRVIAAIGHRLSSAFRGA